LLGTKGYVVVAWKPGPCTGLCSAVDHLVYHIILLSYLSVINYLYFQLAYSELSYHLSDVH
jgi:hypothetical protein